MQEIYHIIEGKNTNVIYDIFGCQFFSVPNEVSNILDKYYNKRMNINDICDGTSSGTEFVEEVINEYSIPNHYKARIDDTENKNQWGVSLHISHHCNLACSYCLVNRDYGNPKHMSPEVLELCLDYMVNRIGNIGSLFFYGGEPTLNPNAINRTVEWFTKCFKEGKIDAVPSFSLITNGTNITCDLANTIRAYNISVGISIDGPPEVHDLVRKTVDGKNTHNRILKNIKILQDNGVQPTFTAVYTPDHIKMGISVDDVISYIVDKCGSHMVNVTYAVNVFDYKEIIEMETSLIEKYLVDHIDSIPVGKVWLDQLLFRILKGVRIKTVCPGGITNIAIDPDGKIFPCQGLVGDDSYQIGSVNDVLPLRLSEAYKVVISKMQKIANVNLNSECSVCWIRNMCNFCPGISLTTFGAIQPSEEYCRLKKESMERIFGKIGEIFSDEGTKEKYVRNFNSRLKKNDMLVKPPMMDSSMP